MAVLPSLRFGKVVRNWSLYRRQKLRGHNFNCAAVLWVKFPDWKWEWSTYDPNSLCGRPCGCIKLHDQKSVRLSNTNSLSPWSKLDDEYILVHAHCQGICNTLHYTAARCNTPQHWSQSFGTVTWVRFPPTGLSYDDSFIPLGYRSFYRIWWVLRSPSGIRRMS